jgi:hypothetical protein
MVLFMGYTKDVRKVIQLIIGQRVRLFHISTRRYTRNQVVNPGNNKRAEKRSALLQVLHQNAGVRNSGFSAALPW